jgi:hypothetical protein
VINIFDEVIFDEGIDPQYFDDIRKQNAEKKNPISITKKV